MSFRKFGLSALLLLGMCGTGFAQLLGLVGVRAVNPGSGYAGQSVTITVTNVPLFATKVYFGTYEASCLPLQLLNLGGVLGLTPATVCTVPAGPSVGQTVDVKVQNALTLSFGDSMNFTYTAQPPPDIISITPATGYLGSSVQITTASNPLAGTTVKFGSTTAVCAPFAQSGGNYVSTCTVPSGLAAGGVNVYLDNNGQAGASQTFTLLSNPPDVMALSPLSGYAGTNVTVSVGIMPEAGTTVTFAGSAAVCTPFIFNGTNYSATCTAPSGIAAGNASVVLTKNGNSGAGQNFNYLLPPLISSIAPASGYAGAVVTVTAASMPQSGTTVMFGANVAVCTSFLQVGSAYQSVCTVPNNTAAGDVNVYLSNNGDNGPSQVFTYLLPPAVGSLLPASGYAGTSVTVNVATMPQSGTTVTFGGSAAVCTPFTVNGANYSATCTAPSGIAAGSADVVLTNNGLSGTALPFTYLLPPSVTSLSPVSGYAGANVIVTVAAMPQSGTTVMFGANAAVCTDFALNGSSYQANCTAPNNTAGAINVSLSSNGELGLPQIFTYLPPIVPANVTFVNPAQGYIGQSVTVRADSMPTSDTEVHFGGVVAACGSFALNAGNYEANCTVPSGHNPNDNVNITLKNTAGEGNGQAFVYLALPLPPAVTALSPDNGFAGDVITVTAASAVAAGTDVMFGTYVGECGSFTLVGGNYQASCRVPSGPTPPTTVAVTLKNDEGSGAGINFTYNAIPLPPAVSALNPNNGYAGDSVVVSTTVNPGSDIKVYFGTYVAICDSFALNGSTYQSTCTVPTGPTAGSSVSVVLQNSSGQGTGLNFMYNLPPAPPAVTVLNPNNGFAGDNIVVTAASMPPAGTTVSFGSQDATCGTFTANGSGGYNVVCTVPGGNAEGTTVSVTLKNNGVSGTGVNFTYNTLPLPPDVTSINPVKGAAGSTVTVTVATMPDNNTTVEFGTNTATCGAFTSNGSGGYSALCTVPSGATSGDIVNVTLKNNQGSGAGIQFTYDDGTPISNAPVISSLTPASGWGGTEVTINGQNLSGGNVTFGTKTAQCVEVSATQLKCTAPQPDAAGSVAVVVSTTNGFTDGSSSFNYNLNDAPALVAPDINITVYRGSSVTLNLSSGVTNGPVVSAALGQAADPSEGTSSLQDLIFTFTPSDTFEGEVDLDYTLTGFYGNVSNQARIVISVLAQRADPTLDAGVKAMLSAQITSAKRYIQTQMGNFNNRLKQIRGQEELKSDYNLSVGVKEARQGSLYAYNEKGMEQFLTAQNTVERIEVSDVVRTIYAADDSDSPAVKTVKNEYATWLGGAVHLGSEKSVGDLDYTTVAVSAGIDKMFGDKLVGGLGFGYTHDKTDLTGNSSLKGDAYSIALYSSYALSSKVYLEALLGYNFVQMDAKRDTINGSANGTRDANQVFGSVGAGYMFKHQNWEFTPFTRVEAAWSGLKAYTESGAGNMNLKYDDADVKTLALALGIDTSYSFKFGWGNLVPRVQLEYLHNFEKASRLGLGYADTDSTPYEFSSYAYARDNITGGLGLDFVLRNNWRFSCDYKITKGDNNLDNRIAAQARYHF